MFSFDMAMHIRYRASGQRNDYNYFKVVPNRGDLMVVKATPESVFFQRSLVVSIYSACFCRKWGRLDNTKQSHSGTKIENRSK